MTMKTKLGTEIPKDARGILYLCKYNRREPSIKVFHEIFFRNAFDALQAYANTPNPESQMASGETYEELCIDLEYLHKCMDNIDWLIELGYCL